MSTKLTFILSYLLQTMSTQSSMGGQRTSEGVQYFKHFPKSFLRSYGKADSDLRPENAFNGLPSWNCEWLTSRTWPCPNSLRLFLATCLCSGTTVTSYATRFSMMSKRYSIRLHQVCRNSTNQAVHRTLHQRHKM